MREFPANSHRPVMELIGLAFWVASFLVTLPLLAESAAAQPIDLDIQDVLAPDFCITDMDQDGDVDAMDFAIFNSPPVPRTCPNGTCGWSCVGDFDADCDVDEDDFEVFSNDFQNPSGCTKVAKWRLVARNWYPDTPLSPGTHWTFGFASWGPVVGVTKAEMLYANTNTPVAGFDFESTPNAATSGGFNLAAGGGVNFVGFLGTANQAIPSENPVDLEFSVNAVPGATFTQIRNAYLGTPGPAPVSLAADEGDASGNPTGNHQSFQSIASVTGLSVPSMPVAGLAALAISLLGVGLRAWHRRR